jgi:hypothetical protein
MRPTACNEIDTAIVISSVAHTKRYFEKMVAKATFHQSATSNLSILLYHYRRRMRNIMLVAGLGISLLASIFMAYGKVFRRRETIEEQSGSTEIHNQKEKEHRMRETRFAQIGAALLILGFSVQIAANVINES